MSVASDMLLLGVVNNASSRSVYTDEALSLGGGQSMMPDFKEFIMYMFGIIVIAAIFLSVMPK